MSINAPQTQSRGQRTPVIEKRRNPRTETSISLWYETDWVTAVGRASNVSREGLFIETASAFVKGATIVISYQASEQKSISVPAEVIWTRPKSQRRASGLGLRFLDAELGARLFEIVAAKQPQGGGERYPGIWSFE